MADEIRAILADPDALRAASDAVFDGIDTDGSGQIDKKELKEALSQVSRDLRLPVPSDEEVQETVAALDTDNSGTISKAEFLPLVRAILEKLASS
jgi:Ca2+-binding EF-hand superfamily protein